MERWINETANVKKDALTIFLISSFIGTCSEMRKLERLREFRLFTSYMQPYDNIGTSNSVQDTNI